MAGEGTIPSNNHFRQRLDVAVKYLRTVAALLLLHCSALAQEPDPIPVPDAPRMENPARAGLQGTSFRLVFYGGYALNFHQTNATLFTGGGECGAFNDGRGRGPAAGLYGEMPVLGPWLDLVLGGTFLQRGGEFGEVYTGGLPVLDPTTNRYTQLERRHSYTANLGYIYGELGVRATPFPEYPLYMRLSGAVGGPVTEATHKQTEEILSPSGVLYPETNTAIREVSSGEIRDAGLSLLVAGAIGYPFPLSRRVTASPEISYYYPLNDVTPNYRWRIASLQAGVALRWSFGRLPVDHSQDPPLADGPSAGRPYVVLATTSTKNIEIVETVVTETFPVLPYIFFDVGSSDLPPRYRTITAAQAPAFDEQDLPHRSLSAYYEILNIIGRRMNVEPGAKITLNGTTDGAEASVAGAANNLARARAQAVKDYLVRIWGIDPLRIAITTSPQPTYPSSKEYAEGAEENRRVEIVTASDPILRPIVFERFKEHTIEPSQLLFSANAESTAGIADWRLDVYAGDRKVWNQSGTGAPPSTVRWNLDETTAARMAEMLYGDDNLRCELTVVDNNGVEARSEFAEPARKELSPFEISRLSLIVFDFDKANINPQNRRMISSFVARSMQPSSRVSITGSTDRLGELAHNQQLSEARAVAVRGLIAAERPSATITDVKGIGPSQLLYDNGIPEGRYYCRTVSVEVRTPVADVKP